VKEKFFKRMSDFKNLSANILSLMTYVIVRNKKEEAIPLILQFMAKIECCEKSFCSLGRNFLDNHVENT
jgi:hypothetical protein